MGRKMGMEIDYRRFGITFTPSDLEALLQDHYTFFTKVPVCVCKIWARFSHGERIYGPHKSLTLSSAMTQSFDKANCTLHTTYQEELCRWSMSRNRPRGAIKIPDRTDWPLQGSHSAGPHLQTYFTNSSIVMSIIHLFFLGSVVCLVFYFIFLGGRGFEGCNKLLCKPNKNEDTGKFHVTLNA